MKFNLKCFEGVYLIGILCSSFISTSSEKPHKCNQLPPPSPSNSQLVHKKSLVIDDNESYRIQCDEGFELFGESGISCVGKKWTHGYCAANVALNRPSNQSTTVSQSGKKMYSRFANDGLISSCSVTMKEVNPSWQIDLLRPHHVTGIRVSSQNILDQDESVDLEIRVGNNPIGTKNPLCAWQPGFHLQEDETKYYECARALKGRYTSIQLVGTGTLKLCEVNVFATDDIPENRCVPEMKTDDHIVSFNGTCYEFATKSSGKSFSEARAQCLARSGELPTRWHLKKKSPSLHLIESTLDELKATLKRPLVWLGAERDPGFTSRSWRWIDSGTLIKNPNWGKDQPNNYNGRQDCAVLDGARNWAWNDVGCDLDYFHWICVFGPKSCGTPDRAAGTLFEGQENKHGFAIGTILEYKCAAPGNYLEGSNVRVCHSDGHWNGSAPTCKFVDCGSSPFFETLKDGKITLPENNKTYFGSEIKYECDEDYSMVDGNEKRICQRDGKWSGSSPKCLYSKCPSPPDVVNGTYISNGKLAGSTVTYKCHPGHVLIGANVLACELGGKYDHPPPMCKYITCGQVPHLEQGTFLLLNESNHESILGSVASATCVDTFELQYKDFSKIVCTESGEWELVDRRGNQDGDWKEAIKCRLITCEEPMVPQGSFVTGYDFTIGSEIQYHCEEGHWMVSGNEIRQCGPTGEWTGEAPVCRYVDCGRTQTIPFGQITYPDKGMTHLNSRVEYSCAPNYKLKGNSQRKCLSNGVWSGKTPKCEEIRCGAPQLPSSSVATVSRNDRFGTHSLLTADSTLRRNINFRVGTMLKFRCERGYKLEGDNIKTCQESGDWSTMENELKCIYVDCGSPGDLENGNVTLTSNVTHYGSTAIYSCQKGYKLKGNGRRICLETSKWSANQPTCQEVTCDDPEPTNATVEITSYSVGGYAKYSCGTGQYLVGETTRKCMEHGIWSGNPSSCMYVECPSPPESNNSRMIFLNSSKLYSAIVEYHCAPGYRLHPNEENSLTCNEFGAWMPGSAPRCLDEEEHSEIFEKYGRDSGDGGGSPWGPILGVIFSIMIIIALSFIAFWKFKKSKRVPKDMSKNGRPQPQQKAQPMVLFPNSINHNPNQISVPNQDPQNHYYDNPTVDPIYENLDDYGVTSSAASVVTINGVAVT